MLVMVLSFSLVAADVEEKLILSSVTLRAEFGNSHDLGTAFSVDLSEYGLPDEYLLSAAHVVLDEKGRVSKSMDIRYRPSEINLWVSVEVVAIDAKADIVLLKSSIPLPNKLKLAFSSNIKLGTELIAIGGTVGTAPGPVKGFLADKRPSVAGCYHAALTFYFGMSGGPIIDASSKLVVGLGVSAATEDRKTLVPNVTFFVPVEVLNSFIKEHVKDLKKNGSTK
jgi:S1-C subfamily serine protease